MQRLEFEGATFSVDENRRTMTGVVVPWNKVGSKADGMRWRFGRGSIGYVHAKFVKFLEDHDENLKFGRAATVTETDEGLVMTFKVDNGAYGDKMLSMAQRGYKTGLSVGVEFDLSDTVADPENPGVRLINLANLHEVSLVKNPAFPEAQLVSVTASASSTDVKETGMPETETAPAETPVQNVTFTREQFDQFMQQIRDYNTNVVQNAPQRQVVLPTGTAQVTEPKPYRFDRKGNLRTGSHEFSTDLFAYNHDSAAADRVMEFVQKQFDIATTDVNELNMPVNRPDMYVDQRDFRYPVWNAINKGTLGEITPFTFPKFSSSSGLVGAHTEGNEPSSGTLVSTNATVTPTAISGKAKITREVYDQGGNPQVSNLIWRQMQKGWFEALEAAAVAVLDAASPTQIDLSGTPGLADEGLDQAITAAFASLQFVRGGFSMDNLFTQIDLYKALVAATDADGRRLYPALGPANANGTVRSRFAALDLNGIAALPAWALAATGAVAASSYLFDSETVHGWASAPQRLDFNIEVANVYIGLWGYKATVISDLAGVREIVYDPS